MAPPFIEGSLALPLFLYSMHWRFGVTMFARRLCNAVERERAVLFLHGWDL